MQVAWRRDDSYDLPGRRPLVSVSRNVGLDGILRFLYMSARDFASGRTENNESRDFQMEE